MAVIQWSVFLDVLLTWRLLYCCQDLIKRQILEQGVSLFGVIAVPCRELVQKSYGIDNAHLFGEQINRVSRDFTQRLCLDIHCVTSVISSSGETTLVCPVSTALARFKNRSSQIGRASCRERG